jgi:hypothetical protein
MRESEDSSFSLLRKRKLGVKKKSEKKLKNFLAK